MDILEMGLRAHTYILRGKVLSSLYKMVPSPLCQELQTLDCYSHPAWLAQQLFRNCPSFKEILKCNICNQQSTRSLTAVQVEDVHVKMTKKDSENFIVNACRTDNSDCVGCESKGSVEHKLIEIGNYL